VPGRASEWDSDRVFPYRLARVNRRLANPLLRPLARWLPPLAVVEHVGRRSGRPYRTPVFAFRRGGEVLIVLSYGDRTEWVQNVLAAGTGALVRRGRRSTLADVRVVPVDTCGSMSALSRFSSRFADNAMVARAIDGPGQRVRR
jgi:deazaflavin-dependent oxidoreductase (nitroreductase family)